MASSFPHPFQRRYHAPGQSITLSLLLLITIAYPFSSDGAPNLLKTAECPETARQLGLDSTRAEVLCKQQSRNKSAELLCIGNVQQHLHVDAAIALCENVSEEDIPGVTRCVTTLLSEQFGGNEVERICRSAKENVFPERCVLGSTMWTSVEIKIARCRHSCNVSATDYCFEQWQGPNETQARAVCGSCLHSIAHVDAFISCMKAARESVRAIRTFEARVKLCNFVHRADSDIVIRCAKQCPVLVDQSDTASRPEEAACVNLCNQAVSHAPGGCFNLFWGATSHMEEEVDRSGIAQVLCDNAVSQKEPVSCFESDRLGRREPMTRAKMCRCAQDHRGRLDCLLFEKRSWPIALEDPILTELCGKSSSALPAVCLAEILPRFQQSQREFQNSTTLTKLVAICSEIGTKPEITLLQRCLSRLGNRWLKAYELVSAVRSCAQLRHVINAGTASPRDIEELSSIPAKCVDMASRHQGSSTSISLLQLCAYSTTTAPGECFSHLTRRRNTDISAEALARMCSVTFGSDPYATACCIQGLPSRASESVATTLCANVTQKNCWLVSACYRDAPLRLTDSEKVSLCTGKARGNSQAACALAAGVKLSSAAITIMCNTADTPGPGVCAAQMVEDRRFEEEDIVTACMGAVDASPARCMAMSQASQLSTKTAFVLCNRAINATLAHLCYKRLASTGLQDLDKAKLCRSPSNLEAAVCAGSKELGLLRATTVLRLCAHTLNATATVSCFQQLSTGSAGPLPLSADDASALCAGDGSLLPVHCYEELSRLGKPFALEFCANAETTKQIECALRAFNHGVRTTEFVRQLCISETCESVATCTEDSPTELEEIQMYKLCVGAKAAGDPIKHQLSNPVLCFKDHRLAQWDTNDSIQLCAGALSLEPLNCREEVQDAGVYVTTSVAAELCGRAESISPARCFVGLHSSAYLKESMVVDLCKQANSTGPAECASSAQFQLQSALVLELCKHAISAAPYHCVQDAPSNFPDFLKVWLCARATSKFPSLCAAAVQASMTDFDKVQLCRNVETVFPASCVNSVPNGLLSKTGLVQLCQNASDITPAHCIAFLERIKGRNRINSTDIAYCKVVKPFAAAINIVYSATAHSKVFPALHDILPITAVIVDQFGYPLGEELANVSAVEVEVLKENPRSNPSMLHNSKSSFMRRARVQEARLFERLPIEDDEVVDACVEKCSPLQRTPNTFLIHDLTTDQFGTLWVTVHVRKAEQDWIEPESIRFYRDMNYWDMVSRLWQCSRIPLSHMQSNSKQIALGCPQMILPKFTLLALEHECHAILEERMAVHVTTETGNGKLCAIIKHGRTKLVLDIDTPIFEMNATERLQLPWNYAPQHLRKAYRTALSTWHPDKWVDSPPDVVKLATDKYTLVQEAYEQLLTME